MLRTLQFGKVCLNAVYILIALLLSACASNYTIDPSFLTEDEIEQYRLNQKMWIEGLKEDMNFKDALIQVAPYQSYLFQLKKDEHIYQYSEGKLPVTGLLFGLFFEDNQLKSLLVNQDVVNFYSCRVSQSEKVRLSKLENGVWHRIDFEKTISWIMQQSRIGRKYNENTIDDILKAKGSRKASRVVEKFMHVWFLSPYIIVPILYEETSTSVKYDELARKYDELASQIKLGSTTKDELEQILPTPTNIIGNNNIWEYYDLAYFRLGFDNGVSNWTESYSRHPPAMHNSVTTWKGDYKCMSSNYKP